MQPPALQPGDTIGVMAPSSFVEQDEIEKSRAALEKKGLNVFIHPQTWEKEHQSAGTHLQKALALQGLWQREDIKAIWVAGGGNRAMHLLDAINFEALKKKPKIFIGFSDVTALLNGIYAHTGIITVHGPVFKNIHKHEQLDHLLDMLAGEPVSMPLDDAAIIKDGQAEGPLIGGNLSLFQYLPRTLPGEFWESGLLFLEDCNEELSRIDRMFLHLKRLGVLGQISGLVLGEFSDMKESGRPFGFTLEDIIREHTEGLDIPIVMNAGFGHGSPFYALPVGGPAQLDTRQQRLHLTAPATSK